MVQMSMRLVLLYRGYLLAKFTNQITENYQIHSEKVCSSQSAARIEENNNLLESTKFEY